MIVFPQITDEASDSLVEAYTCFLLMLTFYSFILKLFVHQQQRLHHRLSLPVSEKLQILELLQGS
jgi:hypothetical protein